MDITLLVLIMAACLCGSYKNSVNLPPPFQGNLAHAIEGSRRSNKPALPYYANSYGNINSGEISGIYKVIWSR